MIVLKVTKRQLDTFDRLYGMGGPSSPTIPRNSILEKDFECPVCYEVRINFLSAVLNIKPSAFSFSFAFSKSTVLNISLSPPQVMSPPSRIFQCSNGHLICEECKQRQEIRSCPTCRS